MAVAFSAKVTEELEITPQSDYVEIHDDGLCRWAPRFEQSAVHCDVDITWFPFDAQTCELIFESWILKADRLNITIDSAAAFYKFYLPSDKWDLTCTCYWTSYIATHKMLGWRCICYSPASVCRCLIAKGIAMFCDKNQLGPFSCFCRTPTCSTETAKWTKLVLSQNLAMPFVIQYYRKIPVFNKADRPLTRDTLNVPWLQTNRQFQWTGDGHLQLPLAELGKLSPNIDLLCTTGSNGRA